MNRKVWTVCPGCGRSMRVPYGKVHRCMFCGVDILPCESCERDCGRCPHGSSGGARR